MIYAQKAIVIWTSKKEKPAHRLFLFIKQGRKDSNPRHLVLETNVLPTELHPYIRVAHDPQIVITQIQTAVNQNLKKMQKN